MLLLSLDMIRAYGQAYENEVKEFKNKYFEDRSKVYFTYLPFATSSYVPIRLYTITYFISIQGSKLHAVYNCRG
jgi:hypothetical protein